MFIQNRSRTEQESASGHDRIHAVSTEHRRVGYFSGWFGGPWPVRRRRWSEDQKREIVAASFAPGAVVREVARRAEVSAGQIYRWRQELRAAASGFAQVLIASSAGPDQGTREPTCGEPAIEVELAGKARVRIPASIPADLASAVIKALARR